MVEINANLVDSSNSDVFLDCLLTAQREEFGETVSFVEAFEAIIID